MRLSKTQKDVLFVLYALRQRGMTKPVPATDIMRIGHIVAFPSNFRTSCHTLHSNGMLNKYRSQSLQLAFTLTDQGADIARPIFEARTTTKQE